MRHKTPLGSTVTLLVLAAVVIVLGAGCRRGGPAPTGATGPAVAAASEAKVVNVTCPIMGNKIDPANVPDALIREHKGQKVGFCCGGCPVAWDKLSDQEKDAKLQAALAKP